MVGSEIGRFGVGRFRGQRERWTTNGGQAQAGKSSEVAEQFILDQLDWAGLGHNTFTQEALALIVRSGEGLLRRTHNLCLSSLNRSS